MTYYRISGNLIIALMLLYGASSMAKVRSDWSLVQAIIPGKITTVLLYKNVSTREYRKLVGRFDSANLENITLIDSEGISHTVQKKDVQKIRTIVPIRKRRYAWILTIAFGISWQVYIQGWDLASGATRVLQMFVLHALTTVPLMGILLHNMRMKEIYNVPPRARRSILDSPS